MADNENKQEQAQFALQRIYVKDLSFESPKVPAIFQKQWQPEVSLDLNTSNHPLAEDLFEVVLSLMIKVENGSAENAETAFVVEVQQAGVFMAKGLSKEELDRTLGAFCPNILFPYAREAVDNLVTRGSFPPIMLAPVNFDALYIKAGEDNEKKPKS
ncbi:MAG: protein-export chaperone SecB [Candidatus Endonucleobacter bathymodioli]|uniref:Protein-export protein SecB n=1 Tax=Candidatus Endonucleibacter bathymodioli TaxID=539814 RepID=A0AA90SXZ4_9GAMM|nr:protein-export chaperone SecB [Candidatus Endonucleobacter bathymodioli]